VDRVICNDGGVGLDTAGEPQGSSNPEVAAWVTAAMPSITALMAAANRIPGVVTPGPEATRRAALGIHSAAIDARDWLAAHSCPESAIGVEFAIAFGEFVALAEECTIASGIPGYDSEDLDEGPAESSPI
jgi:hypothetical protein